MTLTGEFMSQITRILSGMLTAGLLLSWGCARVAADTGETVDPAQTSSAGRLAIEPAEWDFGAIQQTDMLTATLRATNTGAESVRIIVLGGT